MGICWNNFEAFWNVSGQRSLLLSCCSDLPLPPDDKVETRRYLDCYQTGKEAEIPQSILKPLKIPALPSCAQRTPLKRERLTRDLSKAHLVCISVRLAYAAAQRYLPSTWKRRCGRQTSSGSCHLAPEALRQAEPKQHQSTSQRRSASGGALLQPHLRVVNAATGEPTARFLSFLFSFLNSW